MCLVYEGVLKEVVLFRDPASVQIFNVVEHGRRWMRELVYTSDVGRCLGTPIGASSVDMIPRPHWQAGEPARPTAPAKSVVILRSVSRDDPLQTYVPTRFLRGLLPESLLGQYTFWQVWSLSQSTLHCINASLSEYDA